MVLMRSISEGQEIQEKLDKLVTLVQTLIQQHTKADEKTLDFLKKITSIILRMNDRDCNREDLYEELDKLVKEWFSKTI